jgi:hypothetical protein
MDVRIKTAPLPTLCRNRNTFFSRRCEELDPPKHFLFARVGSSVRRRLRLRIGRGIAGQPGIHIRERAEGLWIRRNGRRSGRSCSQAGANRGTLWRRLWRRRGSNRSHWGRCRWRRNNRGGCHHRRGHDGRRRRHGYHHRRRRRRDGGPINGGFLKRGGRHRQRSHHRRRSCDRRRSYRQRRGRYRRDRRGNRYRRGRRRAENLRPIGRRLSRRRWLHRRRSRHRAFRRPIRLGRSLHTGLRQRRREERHIRRSLHARGWRYIRRVLRRRRRHRSRGDRRKRKRRWLQGNRQRSGSDKPLGMILGSRHILPFLTRMGLRIRSILQILVIRRGKLRRRRQGQMRRVIFRLAKFIIGERRRCPCLGAICQNRLEAVIDPLLPADRSDRAVDIEVLIAHRRLHTRLPVRYISQHSCQAQRESIVNAAE